jgi:hypothetical protein
MLKIIKAAEPLLVERINLCIYAQPGIGKTTLAFSAEEPLLLDFDKGAHRASNRKDIVPVKAWADVETLTADDLAPYKTIAVDTAGRALDFLSQAIIADDPKAGRGGALTLQGYGKLKSRFASWLKMLNTLGKDVVLIAHMDEQRNGDDVIERLDVQGGSKGEIYKSVDAMGRIFVRGTSRVLDFSPRENSFGKNPGSLEPLTIPDPAIEGRFLADVISRIKDSMNKLSAEQKAAQEQIEEWSEMIHQLADIHDFNRNVSGIKKAPKAAQVLFNKAAKSKGFEFNKQSNIYEASHA